MNKFYLKERRKYLGLTLKQVADLVGVSESTVSRWETGNIDTMRQNNIVAMAKALQASPLWVMGLPLDNTHIEFQKALKKEAENYVKLSKNFFGDAQKAKNIICAEARLINSLDDLNEEQFNEISNYINYIKNKK